MPALSPAEFNSHIEKALSPYSLKDYKNISDWSSLQSLIVIATIDEHYGIVVGYDEYSNLKSYQDLIDLVSEKIQK